MAVIGSGPAGFYTAYRVMGKMRACVDMYEALPVPYGLVRFGVAPDHPEVKNCQDKFAEVAQSPGFRFVGNVAVGGDGTRVHGGLDVPLETLTRHYDAIVFAYGASRDRQLGVAGEQLRGVYAARDFVGWYNGQPGTTGDGQGRDAMNTMRAMADDLADAETAVVIGQGNVALDVARMLLEDVAVLRRTDISEAAVAALSGSRVRRVHLVGRRGPVQAAFTIKEVRELTRLRDVAMHPVDGSLLPPSLPALPRAKRRLMEVLARGSPTTTIAAARSWSLDFCLTPIGFSSDSTGHVTSASFERTHLADPFDRNTQVVRPTATTDPAPSLVPIPASLVFRSIGYRSEPLAGFDGLAIPFDDRRGLILNDGRGRVLREVRTPDAALATGPHPGLYCAGWVKRGPTGVIASTMEDAFATADAIVHDWQAGIPAELQRGAILGKPRSKFDSTADMLAVLE
ncbi:NADPH-adrenodoxin reductase [Grosmannia clavigera kw1407]|uniref:NADPH:adrenodoxin oxidoreductase, mitochondrial n=1 Tax=Grosmannia clavigera (strain kw1407 / UAMH 11150) TaxID=655863 RepID=F0XF27_GROCL|nr:NADPH-adrenodoxin reductase [Grosmannia clavigera kw1407]EFX04174.1 NADPH-adrenodoxin reductase [Grosmannia clavigera kw1407]